MDIKDECLTCADIVEHKPPTELLNDVVILSDDEFPVDLKPVKLEVNGVKEEVLMKSDALDNFDLNATHLEVIKSEIKLQDQSECDESAEKEELNNPELQACSELEGDIFLIECWGDSDCDSESATSLSVKESAAEVNLCGSWRRDVETSSGMGRSKNIQDSGLEGSEISCAVERETVSVQRPRAIERYKCPECDYKSRGESMLESHISSVHGGKLEPVKCPDCDYKASQKSELFSHINSHHRRYDPDGHPCPHCDHRACKQADLNRHIKSVHSEVKPHVCPECGFRFKRKDRFEDHIASVHRGLKRYKCPKCDYGASRTSTLANHFYSRHWVAQQLECDQCEFKSKRQQSLKNHKLAMHRRLSPKTDHSGSTQQGQFCCTECNYTATHRRSLSNHVVAVHRAFVPLQCSQCRYKAGCKTSLIKHIVSVHKKFKPWQCNECSYTTTDPLLVQKHSMVHKRLKCPDCTFRTNTSTELCLHIVRLHKNVVLN